MKCMKKQYCGAMNTVKEIACYSGKGFVPVNVVDFKSEDGLRHVGIKYKKSSGDKGLMLNYCPFCGEKIDWFREKYGEE